MSQQKARRTRRSWVFLLLLSYASLGSVAGVDSAGWGPGAAREPGATATTESLDATGDSCPEGAVRFAESFRTRGGPGGVVREYRREDFRDGLEELERRYGRNKILPEGYELQALIALAHYPELRSAHIRFRVVDYPIPIAASPSIPSLFGPRESRRYNLIISSTAPQSSDHLLLENIPFNGQIGIIGHELAHIADYRRRSAGGMLLLPLCLTIPDCRSSFERATDRINIMRGLGWQRYDHSRFVRRRFAEKGFVLSEHHTYMGPEEILRIMGESGLYDESMPDGMPDGEKDVENNGEAGKTSGSIS
jgi:hypothetical protein